MSKLAEKLHLAANLMIIIVSALLIGVIVKKYFWQPAPTPNPQAVARVQPAVGTKLDIPGENWENSRKTLVLALQTTCRFCDESAPFYKRVAEAVKDKNVKLIAVLPTDAESSAAHLKELGLTGMEVKQMPLKSIQVSGTPTLILVNNKGEVTDFWIGKLSAEKENEVIGKLGS